MHALFTTICFHVYAIEQNRLLSKNYIREVAQYL